MSNDMKHFEYAVAELNRIQSTQYRYNECCYDYDLVPDIKEPAMTFVYCHPHRGFIPTTATTVEQMTAQVVHEIARIKQEDK